MEEQDRENMKAVVKLLVKRQTVTALATHVDTVAILYGTEILKPDICHRRETALLRLRLTFVVLTLLQVGARVRVGLAYPSTPKRIERRCQRNL